MTQRFLRLTPLCLFLLVAACAQQEVRVVVSPREVTLAPGRSVALEATVEGLSDTRVRWERSDAEAGTIGDAGRFASSGKEGVFTVTATSLADPRYMTLYSLSRGVVWLRTDLPARTTSVPYNDDGSALFKTLPAGSYLWTTTLSDAEGNEASTSWLPFDVQ